MADKQELRDSVRAQVKALDGDTIAWKSYQICDAIQRLDVWKNAKIVCLYASLPNEPVVEFLWDELHGGEKKVCYPRIDGERLNVISVTHPDELAASRWRLREPDLSAPNLQSLEKIDLILVPGLAFSRSGERLGRGGGYYDRLLARESLQAFKLGVCFDLQIFPELPVESHDRQVDALVSESGVLTFV
jgi:5-formyltetrahydrofolate cyclo-ligase